MKVLVVYCHPVEDSFCAALRDAAVEAIRARGCEARVLDLYAENFDPVMRSDERRAYNEKAPDDPALRPHIEGLRWAEALIFVYPTWWYGLPAMLKGWLDRVVIVGQPGRKTILRGIRALCGWRCHTLYLAHYLMDSSTPHSRERFLNKVRRKLERF